MGFIKLAQVNDIKPNSLNGLKINDKKILLANVNGNYYAIGDVCTHMGCQLSKGKLQGETVTCPCHGSTYDLKTGNYVAGPTVKPEPKYELKVENNDILINL
jgi:3-phenylpropionate/trans-cinnamate dioxygenase ferredoxin subunit